MRNNFTVFMLFLILLNLSTTLSAQSSSLGDITSEKSNLVSVLPDSGKQGQAFEITITGNNTQWTTTDYMSVYFSGNGIYLNNLKLINSETLKANINISYYASVGKRDLYVQDYEFGNLFLSNAFTVIDSLFPVIINITPSRLTQGESNVYVDIYGEDTQWNEGANYSTEITFSQDGIQLNSFSVESFQHIRMNVTIDDYASPGNHLFTIKQYENGVIVSTVNGNLNVMEKDPEVTALIPNSGKQGAHFQVTVVGNHFTAYRTNYMYMHFLRNNVSDNNISISSLSFIDSTRLNGDIVIRGYAAIGQRELAYSYGTLSQAFTILDSTLSAILGVSPNIAHQGDSLQISIYGEDTDWLLNNGEYLSINVESSPFVFNSIEPISNTQINAIVKVKDDASIGYKNLTVNKYSGSGSLISTTFRQDVISIEHGTPKLISITPNEMSSDTTFLVTVTGKYTQWRISPYSFVLDMYFSGDGIEANNEQIINDTTITALVNIQPFVEYTKRDVFVHYYNDDYFPPINYTISLDSAFTISEPVNTNCGDADEDETVYAFDASLALRYSIGLADLSEQGVINADVDMDDQVTAFDAALILRYVLGLPEPVITCFGNALMPGYNKFENMPFSFNLQERKNSKNKYIVDINLGELSISDNLFSLQADIDLLKNAQLEVITNGENYNKVINKRNNTHYSIAIVNPYGISSEDVTIRLIFNDNHFGNISIKNIKLNAKKFKDITLGNFVINKFRLVGNYPNPFNPSTTIVFEIPKHCKVKIDIYNVLGELVRTFVNETLPNGHYEKTWYGDDNFGKKLSSGVYYYRLQAGEYTAVKKMILLK